MIKTIRDIAPNGVTGNMKGTLIDSKSHNGKTEFDVVQVDFEENLVALDVWDDVENQRWFRSDSIKKLI